MSIFSVGRICEKTHGRDALKKCVIVDVIDKNFVLITGPKTVTGVRRRKINTSHLKPLPHVLEITKNANDKTIEPLMEGFLAKL